jgi:hypothetical protein
MLKGKNVSLAYFGDSNQSQKQQLNKLFGFQSTNGEKIIQAASF